jgi:thermitase
MGKLPKSLLAVSIVILLSIGSIFLLHKEKDNTSQLDRENRFHASSKIQYVENDRNVLQINSIAMGETIKNHLRNDPSVFLIKHNEKNESHYNKREVTVKFTHHPGDLEIARIINDINGHVVKYLDSTIVFRSNELSASELIQYFNSRPDVIYAEPNYIYLQNQIDFPNDQLYREQYQWNLPVIQTEAGWDVTRGDEKIIIAVVDTGVDLNHPDLRNRLTKGYNVLEDNDYPDDDNGHGTHVAGIIASETNNREGVAGMTWYNKIMPIKAMGAEGYGTTFDIARGIIWAVDNGADVINLSLGNYQPSSFMEEAVKYAYKRNAVIISAAGNDNSSQPSFPAAYPEVLGVSAVSYTGLRAPFSNYGDYIDVSAPGVQIPSTYFNQQYAALSGTSMASPHVAGLAGLILSANPELTNQEVMDIIKNTAYDLGAPGKDIDFGSGLIDVKKALQAVNRK